MNRRVSLSVALAVMGCSGRAAQPIVVDREALVGSREERIEEVVEEDEAREPASLAAPSELHGLIAVQPVEGPGPGQDAMRALWTCERPVRGNLRVELGGVLTTMHGDPLRDVAGETLTRVTVGRIAILEPEGVTLLR